MFKRIFTKNPEILKRFLISVLKLDMNPDTATIEIESNESNHSNSHYTNHKMDYPRRKGEFGYKKSL